MSTSTEEEPQEEAAAPPPATRGGKRTAALIAAGALALVVAGGAGVWFSGLLGAGPSASAAVAVHDDNAAGAAPTFFGLPEILVSLNTGESRSTFLKAKLSLELAGPGDQARIEALLPRILDYCHVYLRELRVEEARGSAGNARLREELLRRIAAAVEPVPVRDVLFDELFVQ
ncbi:MAG: flagellar basal body-associated FliL family protein [Rhodospirillales bacterium]